MTLRRKDAVRGATYLPDRTDALPLDVTVDTSVDMLPLGRDRLTMRALCLLWPLCAVLLASCSNEPERHGRPLFDGRTFEGWEGNLDAFRIENESIVAGTLEDSIPRNEFLCTQQEFDDFELRLEFRLLGEGANAGVQYHTQRIPDHHEVIGYQADMGDGWWGAIYDEMRRNRLMAEPDFPVLDSLINVEGWNEYVIRTEGPRTTLFINDAETVDYSEPDESIPESGRICVQIHSGPPSEAWYRNITLRELPSGAPSLEVN